MCGVSKLLDHYKGDLFSMGVSIISLACLAFDSIILLSFNT